MARTGRRPRPHLGGARSCLDLTVRPARRVSFAAVYRSSYFDRFSKRTARSSGHPIAFVAAFALIVGWLVTGPDLRLQRDLAARHQHGDDDRDVPHGLPHPEHAEPRRRGGPAQARRADPVDPGSTQRRPRPRGAVGGRSSKRFTGSTSSWREAARDGDSWWRRGHGNADDPVSVTGLRENGVRRRRPRARRARRAGTARSPTPRSRRRPPAFRSR